VFTENQTESTETELLGFDSILPNTDQFSYFCKPIFYKPNTPNWSVGLNRTPTPSAMDPLNQAPGSFQFRGIVS
jgi:hypothetical protein